MSFFAELKRRNVIRVGIAYLVVAWLVMQFADVVLNNIEAPGWVFQVIMLVLAIGLPLVLVFAWALEMTPEGLKKEKDVDRNQSITPKTGKKLNNTILVLMALAIAYLLVDKFAGSEQGSDSQESTRLETRVDNEKNIVPPASLADIDNSIAVLPFANRSRDEDDAFFSDGIHDDLLTQLAKINDLKVISRTSVMKYQGTRMTIPEIAAELGVSNILEGGIQRAGDRIRINAQLIAVDTDEHLWAETFDREMTIENIFDIQSEITRQIVTAVKGELSDEESKVLSQIPTDSLAAYEAYLHAKTILNSPDYNEKKYKEAGVWAKTAVENDPEFALAWAMLVGIHGQAIWMGFDQSPERYQAVQDALSKASQYGPFLPETLAARGEYLYRIENDFHAAEIAFRSASKAKPGDTELLKRLAYTQRRTGKWDQAVSNLQLAIELDPDDLQSRTILAETLIGMHEFDRVEPLLNAWIEKNPQAMDIKSFKGLVMVLSHGDVNAARNWYDQIEANTGNAYFTLARTLPNYERNFQAAIDTWDIPEFATWAEQPIGRVYSLLAKSQTYQLLNNNAKALELAQKALDTALSLESESDQFHAIGLQGIAMAYLLTGQPDKALENSEKALEIYPESRDSLNGVYLSNTHAWIMARAGLRDEALTEIARLLNTPAGMDRWDLYLDPSWDFFRDDERFNELIKPPGLEETKL